MSAEPYKYWAFISYSHQDEAWAQWLHRALEKYSIPQRLVGGELGDTKIPKRFFPVYRDREELSSAADLGAALNRALLQSRNLIVVCSPRSATSRWVNEEIRSFRALGRGGRIFCLIVDGEPYASEKPDIAFSECFPPALRAAADDGSAFEPIAADARERKDGKENAKLKLLAGMIGVGFDELKQRDRQRQFWQRVQMTLAGIALAALGVSAWQWFEHKREQREREITIEKLVENGRLELLDGHQARAAVYLNEAYKMGNDSTAVRFMLGQAMQPIDALSSIRVRHGDFATDAFGAVFDADDRYFALTSTKLKAERESASVEIYETASGKLVNKLQDSPPLPVRMEFLSNARRLLITGYPDTEAAGAPLTCVWDLVTSRKIFCRAGINGDAGEPYSPEINAVLIATDHGLEAVDADSGKANVIAAKGEKVVAAGFSQDGTMIAYADSSGSITILPPSKKHQLKVLAKTEGLNFRSVQFTPDGKRVLAASNLSDIRIWDVDSGALKVALAANPDGMNAIEFSKDGRRLLTVGSEGYKVWSAARGILLFSLEKPLKPWASAAISPDGDTLVTTDFTSNAADVWDVLSKRKLFSLDLHTAGVSTAAFSHDSKRLLLASRDGQAEIWNFPVLPRWKYESYDTLPYAASFDHSGHRLLVVGGNEQSYASFFDIDGNNEIGVFRDQKGLIYQAELSPKDDQVVTASHDGTAVLWDAQRGVKLATLDQRKFPIYGAQFNLEGSRVITFADNSRATSREDAAGLWNASNGQLIGWLDHGNLIRSATFSSNGKFALTGGDDGLIKLWDSADGRLVRAIAAGSGRIMSADFSQDDASIVTAGFNSAVKIWSSSSGELLYALVDTSLGLPTQAIFSPDGHEVAIATQSGNVWLWRIKQGNYLTLKGHTQKVTGLRYLQQGQLLLSYADDGTARVWDTNTGRTLGVSAIHSSAVNSVDLSADNSLMVSAEYGRVALWSTGLEQRTGLTLQHVLACRVPWKVHPGADPSLEQAVIARQNCGDPLNDASRQ